MPISIFRGEPAFGFPVEYMRFIALFAREGRRSYLAGSIWRAANYCMIFSTQASKDWLAVSITNSGFSGAS